MTKQFRRPNDEHDRYVISSFFCASTFVLRHLVHIPLVTLVALEFLNVFIGLLDAFAAMPLNDFAQRCIDILGHSARVGAHKEVCALVVDPFPSASGRFVPPMLYVDLLRLSP